MMAEFQAEEKLNWAGQKNVRKILDVIRFLVLLLKSVCLTE